MLMIPLTPEIEQSLHAIATEHGRSEIDIIKDLIERYVEDQEDIRLAEEVMKNPGRIWTMEEVEQELGLDRKMDG
ncbi:Ribbon-helix-helix protein, CopG family [Azospirillaceae bacterium]